jgi:hypothetical protein
VFKFGNPRHDIGSFAVEIVSFLSHGEGGEMVHPYDRKYERLLGRASR